MTRGYSLEQDLRFLINNPKYSDIEILCKGEEKLYGCRAILAARSEVFDRLLYNGMKESYEKQITFPEINTSGMEVILEYVYTGSTKEISLTMDNIVESFHAADYFQLLDLQEFIMKTVKDANYAENYSPELLSKIADTMPLSEDNVLSNLLVEIVSTIPLNTIEFGRFSIPGLQYFLSCTYGKEENPFATSEYEVFRYSVILVAKQVSNDAHKTLMERLPTLEQLENSIQIENKLITDHQKIVKELVPFIKLIDFNRIKGQILADIIDPLKIIPAEIILNIYRQKARLENTGSNEFRGIPLTMFAHVWDESACGSGIIIEDGGKVVRSNSDLWQSVRVKMSLENKGIYEWDVIIKKDCSASWVGVCASENFDYKRFAGHQSTGWVLGSNGYCWNSHDHVHYCPPFGDGTRVTVHLDMNERTLAFTVNGTKYPEVSNWNNLPSKLYPVVSLCYPGNFRIQSCRNI